MPYASVLTRYGPPEVLAWLSVAMPEPGPGQIRIRVRAAGVGPTDLKIRRGDLAQVFPLPPSAVPRRDPRPVRPRARGTGVHLR